MSHHLDYSEPRLDITDVYCFEGTNGTVFVINVGPLDGSGFHPEGLYEFKIDLNGDAREDLTLRATFPADGGGVQRLRLEQLTGAAARNRDAPGKVITPPGAKPEQIVTCSNGIKLFAGERGEPFFIDPRLLVEITRALSDGTAPDLDSFDPDTAQNAFADSNVSAIVVEVPRKITGKGWVGFWANTALKEHGSWHQVQHAAGPVIGLLWDTPDFNASHPRDQKDLFGDTVVSQTAVVVEAMGTYNDPPHGKPTPDLYAKCVRTAVLPDILRYRVDTAARYDPRNQNGRGLKDPVMESIFGLVLNKHVEMGLDYTDATGNLLDHFPYLSEPIPTE